MNLSEARVRSRESAVEEFQRVCELSSDCSKNDYTVEPKRTECILQGNTHICYRALDFILSDQRKSPSQAQDLPKLESELVHKNQEVQALQDHIRTINLIKETDQRKQELEELEVSLDQKETEIVKLDSQFKFIHQTHQKSLKVSAHYWKSQLTEEHEDDLMWTVTYEKRPLAWLGLQVFLGFGTGNLNNQKNQESDLPAFGPSNTQEKFNGTESFLDLGASTLVYKSWWYLKGELGIVSGRKSKYEVEYGSGVGKSTTSKRTESVFGSYLGAEIGIDTRDSSKGWGVFCEAGLRVVDGRAGMIGGIGVNYGL